MKVVAIVGTRHLPDFEKIRDIVVKQEGIYATKVISGDATGVDMFAEAIAQAYGAEFEKFEADWDRYKKQAGPERNSRIAAHADIMLAFPCKHSKGTWDIINKARKGGIPVVITGVECSGNWPAGLTAEQVMDDFFDTEKVNVDL